MAEFRLSLESLASFTESEVRMPIKGSELEAFLATRPRTNLTGYEDEDRDYEGFPEVHGTPGVKGMNHKWSAGIVSQELGPPPNRDEY